MTDIHANLPALRAALTAIREEECDAIVHTGDAIAIGPQPAECLDLLLATPNVQCIMGNHESYFVNGLPEPQPSWMSDGERRHQKWPHARLDSRLHSVLAKLPYVLDREVEGVRFLFLHYALAPSGRDFAPAIRRATESDLDRLFLSHDAALVFYGHNHSASDVEGRTRYVNPGSLGCYDKAIARYCIVEFHRGGYTLALRSVPYDDAELLEAFERWDVPDRHFIYRAFFGGRFHV